MILVARPESIPPDVELDRCSAATGLAVRVCDRPSDIDRFATDASVAIIVGSPAEAATMPTLQRALHHNLPVAVLADTLITSGLEQLLQMGVRWIGIYEDAQSLLLALEKLGVRTIEGSELAAVRLPRLEPRNRQAFASIIGKDPHLLAALAQAEFAAGTQQTVLITGPTGTGKDLLARAIHQVSKRTGRFVSMNVSGVDDTLLSDALFGHTRGGFTGAVQNRDGLVGQAADGTLFLDEIGDMSQQSQIKLLRLLENREYHPIGSDRRRTTNARFVVATHQDLEKQVRAGTIRKDLYFRLRVHEIPLPPLSRRPGDLVPLARHFGARAADEYGCDMPQLSASFVRALHSYSFPGNVRELRSLMYRALAICPGGQLTSEHFTPALSPLRAPLGQPRRQPAVRRPTPDPHDAAPVFPGELPTIDHVIDLLVDEALDRTGGNQSAAARLIGVTPSAISKRLKARGSS